MGRLIDADKLYDDLSDKLKWLMGYGDDVYLSVGDDIRCAVANQPTAYDLDNVVDQLESELRLADKEKERCARENPLQFDSAKGYAMGLSNAIEIVKAGGTDAEH